MSIDYGRLRPRGVDRPTAGLASSSATSPARQFRVTIRPPFPEDLTNDGPYFHGGVIASVMDTAGAVAAWSNTISTRACFTFTEITAGDADGNFVAHGVQTYRIV